MEDQEPQAPALVRAPLPPLPPGRLAMAFEYIGGEAGREEFERVWFSHGRHPVPAVIERWPRLTIGDVKNLRDYMGLPKAREMAPVGHPHGALVTETETVITASAFRDQLERIESALKAIDAKLADLTSEDSARAMAIRIADYYISRSERVSRHE